MSMPTGLGIVDTMIGFKHADVAGAYSSMRPMLKDRESTETFAFPVEYMFTDVPAALDPDADAVELTVRAMDEHGIEIGMIALSEKAAPSALRLYPHRFVATMTVNGNDGMKGLEAIVRARETWDLRSVNCMPSATRPLLAIDDARWYPTYAKCAELGIPIFICTGVPGPRLPMSAQHVEHLDAVCSYFPELTIVTRHGCEPWEDLAVELMRTWPNLHYSTSAFAPRYYPRAIIDYANADGSDQVLYAGYYPMGLSLDRIFHELAELSLDDHVWPKFLRENARRVLRL
jgi:predicted TIM-barrel fold metal-dependent hydrolase